MYSIPAGRVLGFLASAGLRNPGNISNFYSVGLPIDVGGGHWSVQGAGGAI